MSQDHTDPRLSLSDTQESDDAYDIALANAESDVGFAFEKLPKAGWYKLPRFQAAVLEVIEDHQVPQKNLAHPSWHIGGNRLWSGSAAPIFAPNWGQIAIDRTGLNRTQKRPEPLLLLDFPAFIGLLWIGSWCGTRRRIESATSPRLQ